jgi:hypothetical protein
MPISNQDLDYYWGTAIDPTGKDRIFDGQIHVVETNDTRYVLVIDNAKTYETWYNINSDHNGLIYPRPKGVEKQEKYLDMLLNHSRYKGTKIRPSKTGVRFIIIRK